MIQRWINEVANEGGDETVMLDTENISTGWRFNLPANTATTVWTAPSSLDHRIAELEATVAAQARELHELRLALRGVMAALRQLDGDGK